MNRRALFLIPVLVVALTTAALADVIGAHETQGLKTNVGPGEYTLVDIKGPGTFVCAHVNKQGTGSGLCFVNVTIDGKHVMELSYAAMKNMGLSTNNPYGVMVKTVGSIDNAMINFGTPLYFRKNLKVIMKVDFEIYPISLPQSPYGVLGS